MAGYSQRSLPDKLGIKTGHRLQLYHPPPGILDDLAPMPEGVRLLSSRAGSADCILLFGRSTAELASDLRSAVAHLPANGMLWIGWPKRAAKIATDLTEGTVRRLGLATGLVDVKVCAITEVWSGLKFVRRLRDR